ncbi:MAG: helix-turn-helix domain-containing protein [Actinomycetota bacterium]|nr:helix-turn-helix domain-containing protein [Actinomycetota bacterium]
MQLVEEAYYTLAEIAQRLKVSYRTVYRWVQAGELSAYKLGTEWRIAESDLRAFLEARKVRRRPEGGYKR